MFALKCATTVLGLSAFALECYGSERSEEDSPIIAEKGHVEHPIITANVFSIWSFSWMSSLMKKGASKYITEEDLPSLVPHDESGRLGEDLQKALNKQ